ncbi:MAG: DUF433 domain-containing protein [Chloroflexi bacterium]|nr:DUF433 domain-containing protein [Chloroflexota bacterium]
MDATTDPVVSGPRYTVAEAARLAGTSPQNVRRWLFGYEAPGHRMKPVLGLRDREQAPLVSFLDLCELAVVAAFRRAEHAVTLERLRRAHQYAREVLRVSHPFASDRIATEGGHVLLDFERSHPGPGRLVLNLHGQICLPLPVSEVLRRFEYDEVAHMARRFFLYRRDIPVVVDPERGSGLPTIAGRNLRASVILARWKAGQGIASLAEDFELEPPVIEAALRAAA